MLQKIIKLESIILTKLNPSLLEGITSIRLFEEYITFVATLRKNLRSSIVEVIASFEEEKQIRQQFQKLQLKLTYLADTLFAYIYEKDKDLTYTIPNPVGLIQVQKHIHLLMEEMIDLMQSNFPKYFSIDAKPPEKQIILTCTQIKKNIAHFKKELRNTNQKLVEIALEPFYDFLDGKMCFSYGRIFYFSGLMNELMKIIYVNRSDISDELIQTLIRWNFNSARFFNYVTYQLSEKVENEREAAGKLRLYYFYLKKINQMYFQTEARLILNQLPLSELLSKWILEEINYIEKSTSINYTDDLKNEQSNIIFQMIYNLSVSQLACFLRIQHDTGIIGNQNMTDFFEFFSKHVQTKKKAENVSARDLYNCYYNLDLPSLEKNKDVLLKMINVIQDYLKRL